MILSQVILTNIKLSNTKKYKLCLVILSYVMLSCIIFGDSKFYLGDMLQLI